MPVIKSNSPKAKFINYWLPVVVYAALIFFLSSIPGKDLPKLTTSQTIFLHIIEYGILAVLINRALKAYYLYLTFIKRFSWVFFLSFLYAISDEFHQVFVPGRYASGLDLFTDGVGSFIGNWFFQWRR